MIVHRLFAVLALVLAGSPVAAQPKAPDDLSVAFLDEPTLAERGLERLDAGSLPLPAGRVAVMDPLVYPDRPALERDFAPGTYPVTLIVSPSQSRVALAVLTLTPRKPTDFALATLPGQDDAKLGPDEVYGFPVDAGMAAFASPDYGDAIERRIAREQIDDPSFEYFLSSPEHAVVFGLGYDEPFADRPIPEERVRSIMFPSGWGDGVYASWWALDENGRAVALVIDFYVMEDGEGWSEFGRQERDMRASMGEAAWQDASLAYEALTAGDRDTLADLLASGRVDPNGYLPGQGETPALAAVRLNAGWALDVLAEHGAEDTIPAFLGDYLGRFGSVSAFAYWLHDRSSDPEAERPHGVPPLEPRTPELLAAVERFAAPR